MGKKGNAGIKVCPHCGARIRADASACPRCGSDERTGWSESTYMDGISLPDELPDEEEYQEMVAREFGGSTRGAGKKRMRFSRVTIGVAILLLALFLVGILRGVLG